MDRARGCERCRGLADALGRMLREKAPRSLTDAALWLAMREPQLYLDPKKRSPLSERTIYRRLPMDIGEGIEAASGGTPSRIVLRTSGTGRGARTEIDFEQGQLP